METKEIKNNFLISFSSFISLIIKKNIVIAKINFEASSKITNSHKSMPDTKIAIINVITG